MGHRTGLIGAKPCQPYLLLSLKDFINIRKISTSEIL
jgi:hypothetical protein